MLKYSSKHADGGARSMFSGFTGETGEFMWELSFNNERPWFLAHKEQFERCLNTPLKELAVSTAALMESRFPQTDWRLHIARIYRDARRLFGRGPYKEHLWFSVKSAELASGGLLEGPVFWFEVGAADFSYGMGFYDATPAQMAAFRRSLDANPARFLRMAEDIERDGRFVVEGEEYKRPKGDRGPLLNKWYNRRHLALAHTEDFGGALLESTLPETLADAFTRLMPMYGFFLEIYRASGERPEGAKQEDAP